LDLALGYNRAHSAALKNLELVARLDGNPASVTKQAPAKTRSQRFTAGLRRLFVGPLDEKPGAAQSASAR